MRYFEPDFYKEFKCKADKCRHSCCIGWEIDIDNKALRRFGSVTGELGEKLRNNISAEGEAHFILGNDERCPFLQPDGLCELICNLGPEALCDICAEHPRFYNYFENRSERGIGLCCEEAVRLLLASSEPLKILEYEFEGEGEDEPEVLLRDKLLDLISRRDKSLRDRLIYCLEALGFKILPFDISLWRDFYLSLERMEESWTRRLNSLGTGNFSIEGIRYEKLISYFIYRHFVNLCYDFEPSEALAFCVLSGAMIAALDAAAGEDDENIRLYSAEIEYSDENIGLIMEKIAERQE